MTALFSLSHFLLLPQFPTHLVRAFPIFHYSIFPLTFPARAHHGTSRLASAHFPTTFAVPSVDFRVCTFHLARALSRCFLFLFFASVSLLSILSRHPSVFIAELLGAVKRAQAKCRDTEARAISGEGNLSDRARRSLLLRPPLEAKRMSSLMRASRNLNNGFARPLYPTKARAKVLASPFFSRY